ncbi:MAG: hypothetical protein ACYTHM_17730 [Planctomycetota bacterium]|jgi:hypothetical protein
MFGNQRGGSLTPFLIVMVILFLGACGMAWMQSQNRKDLQNKLIKKEAEIESINDRFRAKVNELDAVCKATGYYKGAGADEDPASRNDTVIYDHLNLVNKRLSPPLKQRQITCKDVIDELARQIEWRDRQLDEMRLNNENKENRINDLDATKTRLVNEKQARIDQLLEEHQRNSQRLESEIQQRERQAVDLRERIKNLSADNERISEERRAETQKLTKENSALQARIIALSKREQIESTPMPDGRVTRADIDQGYVYIDLGSKDGVRSGQRFYVYSVLKGGRRREKGEIRIIRVEKDFSQCSILSMMDDRNPVVMGDYIWNKFFVPGRKLIFVFIGKFGGEHVQFTKEQLKKLVQTAGHIASDTVHADTYFAVLGEDYVNDPQYKTVQDYRIDKIKPRDLYDYFGFGRYD